MNKKGGTEAECVKEAFYGRLKNHEEKRTEKKKKIKEVWFNSSRSLPRVKTVLAILMLGVPCLPGLC